MSAVSFFPWGLMVFLGSYGEVILPLLVVGGLFTSTALTLLLLPLIYEWSELRAERRKQQPDPATVIEGVKP